MTKERLRLRKIGAFSFNSVNSGRNYLLKIFLYQGRLL